MAAIPAALAVTGAGCSLNLAFTAIKGNPAGVGSVNYTLAAKNIGTAICQTASVSVYYSPGEKFIASSPAVSAPSYYWKLGGIAPGKEVDVSLTTSRSVALQTGADTTQACLSASNGSDACANAVAASPLQLVQSVLVPAPTLASTPAPASHAKEFGVWEWTPLSQMSAATMQQVVNEAAANGFTAIYTTIDEYLTIDAMPNGTTKTQQLAAYEQSVNTFLTLAARKGIAVDAEAGWRDWAVPGNTWQAYDIMSFVSSYNQSHAAKFRGVQYDIEPYLLPQYATSEGTVLTQYVQLVEGLVNQAKSSSLPLGFDIPIFYTASAGATPEITVDGITSYPYDHILRLLNEIPNGQLLLMDYRNFAAGDNGTIDLANDEVHAADGTNVKVIVGQETGPVTPSYVTFYGMPKSTLYTQIGLVNSAFGSDGSYDGTAIDYMDYFLELK